MREIERFLAAVSEGLVIGQPMPSYFNAPLNDWSPPMWLIRLLVDMAEEIAKANET